MPGKFLWIIFLLLGVWQVISSLAEKAAKKQQEQRLKGRTSPERGSAAGRQPGTTPASTTLVDRAGQLAARRKAQLEELRSRRASSHRPGATPAGSAPATLRPALPTAQLPTTFGRTAPQAIAATGGVRPAPPAPVRPTPRAKARPAPGPRPRLTSQLAGPETESDRGLHALRRAMSAKSAKSAKSATRPLSTATGRHLRLPGLADEPIGPAMLRKMVMYREIFDAPLALRDQQTWERW